MEQHAAQLGLGTWAFDDPYWGPQERGDSIKALAAAVRGGIGHFDTAQLYGNGRAEQLTGQQLRRVREEVVIATKGMYRPPEAVRGAIKKSLRRLCSSYVDIFYLHWPKPGIDPRPMLQALEEARREGLVRCLGVSNVGPEELARMEEGARIDYCQIGYSLLWRSPERDIIPYCRQRGIRIVTYSSLAQGLLAGRFRTPEEIPAEDPRSRLVLLRPELRTQLEDALDRFYRLAEKLAVAPVQLALAWNLSRPWADTVLFGARNRAQVEAALPSRRLQLAPETEAALEELSRPLLEALPQGENLFGHQPR
jgi:aryl-alcohol dehydrogenase-like predicted oxidoreductase